MKKAIAALMAGAMALSATACGAKPAASSAAPAPASSTAPAASSEAAPAAESYTIGICQLIEHPALDAATQGFEEALKEALPNAEIKFDEQNAQGEANNCAAIINSQVSNKVDLILANATAPLQAAAAGTNEIPILGTSITDYATALEIDSWNGTVGGNVSGTSDLAPLDQQADMLEELFPADQYPEVGILFCSAEANSQYQADTITGYLTAKGYNVTPYSFSDTNDLQSVAVNADANCDVIYIPTDNTAASNTELINNVCNGSTPIIAGEEGICQGCGVATLSISYYDLGYTTGQMAAKILTGEADISTMAVEYAPNVTKEYNAANADALNITIPEDYIAIGG